MSRFNWNEGGFSSSSAPNWGFIYSSNTTNVTFTTATRVNISEEDEWREFVGKMLEKGYEIDIVTGGVIDA